MPVSVLFSAFGPFLVHAGEKLVLDRTDDPFDLYLVEFLLVLVRPDVRGIRDQDASGDETVRFRLSDDVLEDLLEHVVPLKASAVGLADRRMVGNLLIDAETEEPTIGEVRLNLLVWRTERMLNRGPSRMILMMISGSMPGVPVFE